MSPLIAVGRVSWFKLDKKFGFVELEGGRGDAFLHVSVLKAAGYVSVPAGTTMQVRVEHEQGRQRVIEVLTVDTRTARPGEPAPVFRKVSANGS
jgi:cold shock protein